MFRAGQIAKYGLSCSIQKRNAVCVQKWNSTAGQVLGIQAAAKFGFAGFFALELAPAGACRAAEAARPAVCQAPDGAWVASPQSPILRRSDSIFVPSPGTDNKKQPTGLIIPLLTAQTCPLLIAPPQSQNTVFRAGSIIPTPAEAGLSACKSLSFSTLQKCRTNWHKPCNEA